MCPKGQVIDWTTNRFTKECGGSLHNRGSGRCEADAGHLRSDLKLDMLQRTSRCISFKKSHHIWLGRSPATWSSIWGSSAGHESSTRRWEPGSVEGVLGGGKDVGHTSLI
jgi:hypothetical protein